jgi:putative transposase
VVCDVLGFSRETFLKYLRRPQSVSVLDEEKVVLERYWFYGGSYGRIRLKKDLAKNKNLLVSEGKVSEILKRHGLSGNPGIQKTRKALLPGVEGIRPNLLLNMDLHKLRRNQVWASDFTELKVLHGRKVHMVGVLDIGSRQMMGLNVDIHERETNLLDALHQALAKVDDPRKIIFHSDNGCQFTARKTKVLLDDNGLVRSYSRKGTPNDNQYMESAWSSLKCELGKRVSKMTVEQATAYLYERVLVWYNSIRMHSGIDYRTPCEAFEQLEEHLTQWDLMVLPMRTQALTVLC